MQSTIFSEALNIFLMFHCITSIFYKIQVRVSGETLKCEKKAGCMQLHAPSIKVLREPHETRRIHSAGIIVQH